MKISDLSGYVSIKLGVEYKTLHDSEKCNKIYCRIAGDRTWKELDYDLCIPQGCSIESYTKFTNDCSDIKSLHSYMKHNKEYNVRIKNRYTDMYYNYQTYKYLGLILLVFLALIGILIGLSQIEYSRFN